LNNIDPEIFTFLILSKIYNSPINLHRPKQLMQAYHQYGVDSARLFKLQKGCTRLAVASEKVYQLLAHGRWFSPGIPASSTPKTDRHDTAEILLKVAQNTINKSINPRFTAIQLICIANECFGQKTRAPWMITQYIALGC
jgi:hypothetical protein